MKKFLLLPFACVQLLAFGQQPDSTLSLNEIEIVSMRIHDFRTDSVIILHHISSSISQLLAATGEAAIATYGPPGAAEQCRMRGAASDHTLVSWNGLAINSLTLGTCDISMLPLFFFEQVSISPGGSTPLPAIGGSIDVKTRIRPGRNEVRLLGGINSMRNSWTGANLVLSKRKMTSDTRFFYRDDQNHFNYLDHYYPGGRRVWQENNSSRSMAAMQNIDLTTGMHSHLHASLWLQQRSSLLPATMGSSPPYVSNQDDRFARSAITWNCERTGWAFQSTLAYFSEYQLYQQRWKTSNETSLENGISSRQWISNSSARRTFGRNWSAGVAVNGRTSIVLTGSYENGKVSEEAGIISENISWIGKFSSLNIRAWSEWRDKLLHSAEVREEIHAVKKKNYSLQWVGTVARVSRYPDLNERFWKPGGNNLLQPERATNVSLQTLSSWNGSAAVANASVTLYRGWVDQWIQWVPTSEGWWTPVNYKSVRRKGLDLQVDVLIPGKLNWKFIVFSAWNQTMAVNGNTWNDEQAFELAYVPPYRAGLTCVVSGSKGSLICGVSHVSSQKTNEVTSATNDLPAYQLAHISLARTFHWVNSYPTFSLGVQNLFNTHYETIRSYALPGRTFEISFQIPIFTHSNPK